MSNIWDELEKDKEIEEIAQMIMMEIEGETSISKNSEFITSILQLSDIEYIKRLLRNVEVAHTESVCTLEKLDILKGVIIVTWMQRMYSTIRSLLLGVIAALVLVPLLLSLGSIDFIQNIIISVPIFCIGLIVTRLLDKQIMMVTKKVVKYLSNHKKLRKFLMNNF